MNFLLILSQYFYHCSDLNKSAFFYNEAIILSEVTQNYILKSQAFIGIAQVAYKLKLQAEQVMFLKKALQYTILA